MGDDAAVINHEGYRTLVSVDLLVEGIHFDMTYTPLRHLGYKAAVVNFTKYMCGELATKFGPGLRVNAIAPGFFLTEQNRTLLTNPDGSLTPRSHSILSHTPYKRFGEPEELLGTLQWLASDASQFVSGTVTVIDGGFDAFSI